MPWVEGDLIVVGDVTFPKHLVKVDSIEITVPDYPSDRQTFLKNLSIRSIAGSRMESLSIRISCLESG